MNILYKIYKFLGLNEETNRFLTMGLCNNLVVFFYTVYKVSFFFFVGNILKPHFLERALIVSTVFFSLFFKKNGVFFQEKIINKKGVIPKILFYVIFLELHLTLKISAGLKALLFLEIFLLFSVVANLQEWFIFKIFAIFTTHFFLFYVFFRSTISSKRLKNFHVINRFLYKYRLVYDFLQQKEIILNKSILVVVVLFGLITNQKLYSIFF